MQSSKLINLYIYYKRTLANVYFIHLRSHSIIFIWLVATLLVLQYVFTTDARILIRKFLFHFILLWSPAVRFLWHMCYIHNLYLCIFLSVAAAKKGFAAVSFPFSDCLPFRFELVELSMQKKKKSASHSHKQTQTHASGFRNIRSAVFLHLRISWISLKYFVLLLAKKPKWLSLPGQRKRKNNEKEQSASHSFRDQLADWLTDWLRSAT